jgi:hypothetical protein
LIRHYSEWSVDCSVWFLLSFHSSLSSEGRLSRNSSTSSSLLPVHIRSWNSSSESSDSPSSSLPISHDPSPREQPALKVHAMIRGAVRLRFLMCIRSRNGLWNIDIIWLYLGFQSAKCSPIKWSISPSFTLRCLYDFDPQFFSLFFNLRRCVGLGPWPSITALP